MAKEKDKLSTWRRISGLFEVAKIAYKASPSHILIKIAGSIIDAVLPLITVYYAALTTTALTEAYSGSQSAGGRAVTFVIITALLGVLTLAWNSISGYIDQITRYKISVAVNDRLYQHFLNLEFWQYDDKNTADLFDKAVNFSRFFGYVFNSFASIGTQIISLIASLVALSLVNWWLGLILIMAVIPGVVIQFMLSREQIEHWNKNVETRRKASMIERGMFQINMITELRLYGLVRYLLDLGIKLRETDEKIRIEFEKKYIVKQMLAQVLEAVAEIIALIFTVTQIIARLQPVGQFLYVQQVISRALSSVRGFALSVNSLDEDIANLFNYQEFMKLPESISRPIKLKSIPNSIDVCDVSFSYPNTDVEVLKNISLKIKKGDHIAIVGENGAGKSTLIKLIMGLYNPSSGKIILDENDMAEVDVGTWHKYLGVLQQTVIGYYFATAAENVYLGDMSRPKDKKLFNLAIDRAESRKFLEKLPKGFNTYVDRWMEDDDGNKGVELSGGQWQKLALARNFYRNSPILILDEPTSAIDALAESRIFNRLFSEKDKTIVTISHRLTTVEKADKIYMLDNGAIVESGTHEALVQKRGYYYRMFESQLHESEK